jgi:superkiller protein 3
MPSLVSAIFAKIKLGSRIGVKVNTKGGTGWILGCFWSLVIGQLVSAGVCCGQSPSNEPRIRHQLDSLSLLISREPSRELLFERAWRHIDLEDWASARADFEAARRLKGKKAETDLAAGIAYTWYRMGRYGMARQWCDSALAHHPNNAFALLYRGWSHYYDRNLRLAESDFSQYVKLRPAEPHGWYARQEVRRSLGDWANALADIERALKIEPYNSLYLERKATLLNRLGRSSDAFPLIEQLKSQLSGAGALQWVELARLHLRIGESGAALDYINRAHSAYDDSLRRNRQYASQRKEQLYDAYLLRGLIHERRGEYLHALRDYQRAVRINEAGYEAWGRIGDLESMYRGNYYAAAEAYRKCFRLQPKYPVGWVNWGYSLGAIKHQQKALEVYRRALSLDSVESRGLLLNNYGFTCLEQRLYGRAKDLLEQAVAEYPDLPMAHISLGEYLVEIGQYQAATERFLHALSMPNPGRREKQVAHLKLGIAFARQQDAESALEQFESALLYDPYHVETLFEKGRVLVQLGRYCEAVNAFQQARLADEQQGEGRSREISRHLREARLRMPTGCP